MKLAWHALYVLLSVLFDLCMFLLPQYTLILSLLVLVGVPAGLACVPAGLACVPAGLPLSVGGPPRPGCVSAVRVVLLSLPH